jgi:hypothetical protein
MTIGDLYDKIESWSEDTMDFCVTDVFSWRGIYAEPACSLSINNTTKQENLDMLRKLITDIFRGWKGGTYTYNFEDEIHFECDGGSYSCGEYLIGFLANNHSHVIKYIFG